MARRERWDALLGKPFSEGGSAICSKHDFIESNSDDPEMAYEIACVASAAREDGKNMEAALRNRKERIKGLEDELEEAHRENEELRNQIEKMSAEVIA